MAETPPPNPWINPGMRSLLLGDTNPNNPWLAITQVWQETLELRREIRGSTKSMEPCGSPIRPQDKICRVQMQIWMVFGGGEAQGQSWEVKGKGGTPEGDCRKTQGKDEKKRQSSREQSQEDPAQPRERGLRHVFCGSYQYIRSLLLPQYQTFGHRGNNHYLHCVGFPRSRLSVGKYGPIVAPQNICTHKDK